MKHNIYIGIIINNISYNIIIYSIPHRPSRDSTEYRFISVGQYILPSIYYNMIENSSNILFLFFGLGHLTPYTPNQTLRRLPRYPPLFIIADDYYLVLLPLHPFLHSPPTLTVVFQEVSSSLIFPQLPFISSNQASSMHMPPAQTNLLFKLISVY